MDWTYDLFVEDSKAYKDTPIKGVYPSRDAVAREVFMRWLKSFARDFKNEWCHNHAGRLYDRHDGYVGDAFADVLMDTFFSDLYKDAYCQRPHLPIWYYVTVLGLPMLEDMPRTFCAEPVEDAVMSAKLARESF